MSLITDAGPASHCVIPINDIRGIDSMVYAKGEKLLRSKLAAVYRLIDLYGWTQGIYNHVTVSISIDDTCLWSQNCDLKLLTKKSCSMKSIM